VDEMLLKPEIAAARSKIVIMQWRQCVTDKATSWSRLRDDAATIAVAAVSACTSHNQNLRGAFSYELRSKGIPTANPSKAVDELQATMKDLAVEVVVSERAKRLPRP
jgi:hypothetical protein